MADPRVRQIKIKTGVVKRNCSLPDSSVHGVLQARILKWVAISSSRGSSQPRDQTHVSYVSCIGRLVKEKMMYEKEAKQQEEKIEKMKAEDGENYAIKKQAEILQESRMMIPDCQRRLEAAHTDLLQLLESEKDLEEAEEYKEKRALLHHKAFSQYYCKPLDIDKVPWTAPRPPAQPGAPRSDWRLQRPLSSESSVHTLLATPIAGAPAHRRRPDGGAGPGRGQAARKAQRPLRAGRARPGRPSGTAGPRGRRAAAASGGRAGPAEESGYFVTAPSTQASLPPLNETPLLRDVQPLHLIKEIALQC
ncbi:hypothetical protein R6Z07M_008007 [Ovis aries]